MAARRTTRDGIVCGEVDGVPAFWPPTREGPAAALLMFRVGQADETLPVRGITHMVEHLALVPTGRAPHDYNGQTGSSTTSFGVVGQPGELVGFFDALGQALRSLPVDRLASECTVLQTEEQSRAHSSQALWSLRWGPNGHGLMGYDELGVHKLDGDSVQQWADRWFVRQNAALVLNGPPPRGLRLPLGDGVRAAPPVVLPAVEPLPTWYPQQPPTFGLSYLRDRSAASAVAAWLLQERMHDALRREHGLVYGVSGGSAILTGTERHDILWTQALDEKLSDAVTAMLAVLADADRPMSADERKAWTAKKREHKRQSASIPGSTGWATYLAESLLYGAEASFDEFEESTRGVREPDVLAALAGFLESMVLALPEDTDAGEIATPIRQESGSGLSGKALKPAHGQTWTLTLSPEGVSTTDTANRTVSVRFDACAAVRAWDDGARVLVGADGFAISYRPEQWKDSAADVSRAIDTGVGPERVVQLGTRVPLDPPAPTGGRSARDIALLVLAAVFLLGLMAAPYDPGTEDTTGVRLTMVAVFAALVAGLAFPYCRRRWDVPLVRWGAIAVGAVALLIGVIGCFAVPTPS